jgi:hypothetical protein
VATNVTFKNEQVIGWTIIAKIKPMKLNLGSEEDPKEVLVSVSSATTF